LASHALWLTLVIQLTLALAKFARCGKENRDEDCIFMEAF
jgi:hypothetical protein